MPVVCAKYLSTATMSSPSSVWCLVFCGFDGKENKQELYKTYQNQFGDTSNIYEEYIYIYIYIYMKWTMLHVLIHLLPKPKNFHHVSRQIK